MMTFLNCYRHSGLLIAYQKDVTVLTRDQLLGLIHRHLLISLRAPIVTALPSATKCLWWFISCLLKIVKEEITSYLMVFKNISYSLYKKFPTLYTKKLEYKEYKEKHVSLSTL